MTSHEDNDITVRTMAPCDDVTRGQWRPVARWLWHGVFLARLLQTNPVCSRLIPPWPCPYKRGFGSVPDHSLGSAPGHSVELGICRAPAAPGDSSSREGQSVTNISTLGTFPCVGMGNPSWDWPRIRQNPARRGNVGFGPEKWDGGDGIAPSS